MHRWTYLPHPRHPLARLFAGVLGGLVLVVVIAFGMFAAAALFIIGAVVLLLNGLRAPHAAKPPGTRSAPPGVIEGEFTVVGDKREKMR
ncbi:MAG: hypothetical protein WBV61_02990 [Rhodanobacteraceae bacterium]